MRKALTAAAAALIILSSTACGNKNGGSIGINDSGKVVWDNNAITVTYEKYDDSDPLCPNITLKAKNKTDIDLYLYADGFYINDFDYDVMMSQLIPSGETVEATFEVLEDAPESIGYSEVGKVSFWLLTNNPDKSSFDDVYLASEEIVIDTGHSGWKESLKAPDGELIYDDNGLRITALVNSRDCVPGSVVPMLIENSTGNNLSIIMDRVRLDGVETYLDSGNGLVLKKDKNSVKLMSIFDGYNTLESKQASKTEVQFSVVNMDSDEGESFETGYLTVKGV